MSGVYHDFPSYYYEKGNQFGSYLLGHTPKMSWDTKKYIEVTGGGDPVISSKARAPRAQRQEPSAHDTLMQYVRLTVGPEGARRIHASLAAARGVQVNGPRDRDPYGALDDFVIAKLSANEQTIVLQRLKRVIATLPARPKRGQRSVARRNPQSKPPQKPRHPAVPRPKAAVDEPSGDSRVPRGLCGVCQRDLSPEETAASLADRGLFMGHTYCAQHAAKLRATLAKGG